MGLVTRDDGGALDDLLGVVAFWDIFLAARSAVCNPHSKGRVPSPNLTSPWLHQAVKNARLGRQGLNVVLLLAGMTCPALLGAIHLRRNANWWASTCGNSGSK